MSSNEEDEEEVSCHIETFRAQIARFSMVVPSAGPATTPREISQKPSSTSNNHALTRSARGSLISPEILASPRKRLEIQSTDGSPSPSKKTKRGYAAPETYAHLKPLGDYLKESLDAIFCGINPGQMSSKSGHHFAHPTNHFWKCLYQSGLTNRQLPPSEDSTLPELFNIGLTNLVPRPSAEAAELSSAEMTACVPTLLGKIYHYQPRVVCFVGRVIWEKVETVLLKQVAASDMTPYEGTLPLTIRKEPKHPRSEFGLQPMKIIHKAIPGAKVTETLVYVVPSTSGRVRTHQLPDKVELFRGLKNTLLQLAKGELDTSRMMAVNAPPDESCKYTPASES